MLVHLCAPPKLTLYDSHVSCVCCCLGTPLVSAGSVARTDSAGYSACEECGRRLSRCKGKPHRQDPGHICHRCYTQASRTPSSVSPTFTPLVPKRSHKRRRADSDPGMLPANTHATPAEATEQPEDTNWDPTPEELASGKQDPQLAAAIAAQEAEWAARTPAQWARRHYLLHVAPRCERCNFPRTGKKGWDESKQCHSDKDCNTNRWRVLDAFC
jgi:hypothetical protein